MSDATTGSDVERGEARKVHPPAESPPAADGTRCAECEELERRKRDPISTWLAVAGFGTIILLTATTVQFQPPAPITLSWFIVVSILYAFSMHANIIGQPEFAFLDARGLLHRHFAMPRNHEAKDDPLNGRFVANIARFEHERMLRTETGTHGSDGAQFLVDGAILQLRRGGWFRKARFAYLVADQLPAWKPQRCWRGMDDLVLLSKCGENELHVDPKKPHFALQLINDPTSSIARLLHDHRTLGEERVAMSELIERERAEHHAAIAEKDARIEALGAEQNNSRLLQGFLLSRFIIMLAHLERAKQSAGRSRHAPLFRKIIAFALDFAGERSQTLREWILAEYGRTLRTNLSTHTERVEDEAAMGEDFLAELDTVARTVELERKAASQDAVPPAALPSA